SNAVAPTRAVPSRPQARPRHETEDTNVPAIPRTAPTTSPTDATTRSSEPFTMPDVRTTGNARSRGAGVRDAEPERARLADPFEIGAALLGTTGIPGRQVVGVEHVVARFRGEEARELDESDEALFRAPLEGRPATRVLFRPEEVHARSEEGRPAPRGAEAVVEVSHDAGRIDPDDPAVPHLDRHRIAAVEARGVDAHGLAGKEPRDRGCLESTLGEPALLAAHGDPVLGRQVVQRRERGDVVGLRGEAPDPVSAHHGVEEEGSLFDSAAPRPRGAPRVQRAR